MIKGPDGPAGFILNGSDISLKQAAGRGVGSDSPTAPALYGSDKSRKTEERTRGAGQVGRTVRLPGSDNPERGWYRARARPAIRGEGEGRGGRR